MEVRLFMTKKRRRFCEILVELIDNRKMTKVQFYTQLGITKPYFYDIITGKVNPPPSERQIKIAKILNLTKEDSILLFNAAAVERGEVPVDVAEQLKNDDIVAKLRENIDYDKLLKIGDIQNV